MESDGELVGGNSEKLPIMVEVLGSDIQKTPLDNAPSSIGEWVEATQLLEAWGDVPADLLSLTSNGHDIEIESKRGTYRAEYSSWPVSGMRARMRSGNSRVEWPIGGLSVDGLDSILIWKQESNTLDAEDVMRRHIMSQDIDSAIQLLERCGRALAAVQEDLSDIWTGPSNSRSWNSSIAKLEEATKSRTLWRAPFKPGMPAVLSMGKMSLDRFSESKDGIIRLRPAMCGPSDAYSRSRGIEWPALRDLAALMHNIGEIAHGNVPDDAFVSMRLAAISGWTNYHGRGRTGGVKPRRAIQIIGGGLPIWEYEQALSSKFDSSENLSGTRSRTNYILTKVAPIQRRLFTIRIFSAASLVGASSAFLSLIASLLEPNHLSFAGIIAGTSVFILMNGLYRYMAPEPESVFM